MSDNDSANTKTTSGSSTTLPQPPTMGHTLSCSSSSIPVSSIELSGSRGFIPLRRRSSVSRPRDVIVVLKKLPVRIQLESDGELQVIEQRESDFFSTIKSMESAGSCRVTWVGSVQTEQIPEDRQEELTHMLRGRGYEPVFLPTPILKNYIAFCKCILWPLFNSQLVTRKYTKEQWTAYKKANAAIANAVRAMVGPSPDNDLIWIHNYHLLQVPFELRKLGITSRIGFFNHTPFPSSEMFRALPMRSSLLKGVLGADLLGFQTYDDSRHFLSTCTRVLAAEAHPKQVRYSGSTTSVDIMPIGIDAGLWEGLRQLDQVKKRTAEIRSMYEGKKIIVGLDALDETMGIHHKLVAFGTFLERHPEWLGKVVLFQICSPPDTLTEEGDTRRMEQLHLDINELVGKINGKWSSLNFSPISYLYTELSLEEQAALYAAADMALLTPLREGMNLVSHEFVLCQQDTWAPLVVSEFAGAAQSLVGALLVNPWNTRALTEAIITALTMDDEEKKARHQLNCEYVTKNTASFWGSTFITELSSIELFNQIPPLKFDDIMSDFAKSKKRLFLLDYDGTLTPIVNNPMDAIPSQRLISILTSLTRDPHNAVYVVSGRDRPFLNSFFGALPIGMSCEHGVFFRPCGEGRDWEMIGAEVAAKWKDLVLPVLQEFASRTPGSMIEVKEVNLSWHYRNADEDFGLWQAKELAVHLQDMAQKLPIDVIHGKKVIEVRPSNINKGATVRKALALHPDSDFIMCMGDDRTDEDMFCALDTMVREDEDKMIYTCTVGRNSTSQARYYLRSQTEVMRLLGMMSDAAGSASGRIAKPVSRFVSSPAVFQQ